MSLRDIINWVLDVNLLEVFFIIIAVIIIVTVITWIVMGIGMIFENIGKFLHKVGDVYDKYNKLTKILFWIFVFGIFYFIHLFLKS